MAIQVPKNFKLREKADPSPSAIVRLDPSHGIRIEETDGYNPSMIRFTYNLYASQASFEDGDEALVDNFERISLFSKKPKTSDPSFFVDPCVDDLIKLIKSVGYKAFHNVSKYSDFKSDEEE